MVEASRLALDMLTSCRPNSPRMKSTCSMGSRSTAMPTMAGKAEQHHHPYSPIHGAREIRRIRHPRVFGQAGRITALMATAKRPRETPATVRVIEIADGTVARNEASMVLTSRLIWLTETPNRAGDHQGYGSSTPGWCQPHFGGQTSMLSWRRKGDTGTKLDQTAEEDTDRQEISVCPSGRDPPAAAASW